MKSDATSFDVGDEFLVTIFLDTQGESVNAFEGTVVFPEDLVELKGIQEHGSIVNVWVQEPKAEITSAFSGLTPGGYMGEGVLFSLIFKVKAMGAGSMSIEQGRVLLNDGMGTDALLEISHFNFLIFSKNPNDTPKTIGIDDSEAPEPFELKVGQDPGVFGGQPFLVFAALDKNSGVDHYEISFVSKGRQTVWTRAESPFSLAGHTGTEEIFVKAVDRAGNERIASLLLQKETSLPWFIIYGNAGILVAIGGILVFWLWRKKNPKYEIRNNDANQKV